jgi:hypothetical protein
MDPNAAGAPAVGGAPESSDPADGDNPFGDDEGDDDSENPFAKGKSDSKSDSKGKDDKKSDKKSDSKGGNPFAKKKSSWTKVASATHLHAFTYAPSDEEASSMVNKIRGAAVGTVDAMRSPGTRLNHPEVHVRAHRSDSKGTDFVNGLLNSGHWTEHTSSYKTANGAQLSEADYLEHLFIRTAVNKSQAIATVRSTRGL